MRASSREGMGIEYEPSHHAERQTRKGETDNNIEHKTAEGIGQDDSSKGYNV